MSDELRLTISGDQLDELEQRITDRVLERLEAAVPERLMTVDEVAEMLATTPEWVRRHKAELGGYRLSEGGGRSPIRFRASEVEAFLKERRLRPPASAKGWRNDPNWSVTP
jgi:hypothetical protein